ncbi:unnamed protein product [Heligmosomoides polygyrus]|uniref:Uncharacterized protein n=1 Tax=Heligmosomoides polygyrus TaxID=6339 RepID=A0A183FA25_HELPZ|nr:unnamed protein product [Heligmosomoides polygyrus]
MQNHSTILHRKGQEKENCHQRGKIGFCKETFFEQQTGPRKKLFLVSVLFVEDFKIRLVLVLQLDETFIAKRKYNPGHMVRSSWMVRNF